MEHYAIQSIEGRDVKLAMQELWLGGEVLPAGARLIARHVFESAEDDPLEVIYSFMLPRDAALRQFRIEGEGFSVTSELQSVKQAEETYEEAMAAGQLASMTRNYRDGVTNLMVGNLQPGKRVTVYLEIITGVEARDDGFRLRFPFTLAPSYHPQACAVSPAPGEGEMELPEEKFGDVILPAWRADASGLHRVGFDLDIQAPGGVASIQSPSHTLNVQLDGREACRVELSREADLPNRDLILDVKLKGQKPLVYAGEVDGKTAIAAWIPSHAFGDVTRQPGRTVFVVDRSGSMDGAPMEQAKRAVRACLGALGPEDQFNIIAFDNEVDRMSPKLVHGDAQGRKQAEQFLETIDARGGTEMQRAVFAAADQLKQEGGDIFLLTDGQVFETEAIINKVKALGLRVHCLGIGSASQDRFLSQLARQTGGTSRFVSPSERVDQEAMKLFSGISSPVASELTARMEGGSVVQANPVVFAGSPVQVFGETEELRALEISYRQDEMQKSLRIEEFVEVPALAQTLRLIRGARLITDFEARMETPEGRGAAARREHKRMDGRLEKLSRDYGLASRAMALVAVVESEVDASGKLAKTRIVPVGLPEGMAPDACFGAQGASANHMNTLIMNESLGAVGSPLVMRSRARGSEVLSDSLYDQQATLHESMDFMECDTEATAGSSDPLMELASRLEPDGGMPGDDEEARLAASLYALLCFASQGHTRETGTYRRHVERLVTFIQQAGPVAGLPEPAWQMVDSIVMHQPAFPGWAEEVQLLLSNSDELMSAERWSETWSELMLPKH